MSGTVGGGGQQRQHPPPPPTLSELRRLNAERWDEIVSLHGRLHAGEDNDRNEDDRSGIVDVDPLHRRIDALRAEIDLLRRGRGGGGGGGSEKDAPRSNNNNNKTAGATAPSSSTSSSSSPSSRLHQSLLEARHRHASLFGSEIVSTHDALSQVLAVLDRSMWGDDNRHDGCAGGTTTSKNGVRSAGGGGGGLERRVAQSKERIEQHRIVHLALQEMVAERRAREKGRGDGDGRVGNRDGSAATDKADATGGDSSAEKHDERKDDDDDDDDDELRRAQAENDWVRSEISYACRLLEEQQHGGLRREEKKKRGRVRWSDTSGDAGEAETRATLGKDGDGRDKRRRRSRDGDDDAAPPLLDRLLMELARRCLASPSDPYVAVGGASAGGEERFDSEHADLLVRCGIAERHPDVPRLLRLVRYL